MIIGIDVDLTIVDTLTPWYKWYLFKTGHDLTQEEIKVTNVADLMVHHSSPTDYWRQADLYDNLKPIPNAKETIDELREMGHEIVFVSYCFPEHFYSKQSFLNRNFGPGVNFVDTKNKEFVKMDVFIDDHTRFLDKVKERQPDCFCLQKGTHINKRGEYEMFNFWRDVIPILKTNGLL